MKKFRLLLKKNQIKFVIVYIVLACFIGCATRVPKNYGPLPEINEELANNIRDTILLNESKLLTLKAKASIQVKSKMFKSSARLSGVLRFKRPNSLRLITSKLTFTIFDMIYVGNQIWFNVPSEERVYAGFFDENTLVEGFGVSFKPFDVINVFNLNELFDQNEFKLEVHQDSLVMHIVSQSHPDILLANLYINRDYTVRKYDMFDSNGKLISSITFKDYIELEDCNVPQIFVIKWPREQSSFTLEFKDLDVNKELSDKIFHFSMPKDYEIVPIGNWFY